jgi:hypothetical protein
MQLDAAELIRTRVDLYSLSELPASNGATLPSDRCEFEYMVFCTSMSVAPCSQRRERHEAPNRAKQRYLLQLPRNRVLLLVATGISVRYFP